MQKRKWVFSIITSLLIGLLGIFSSALQSTTNKITAQFEQPTSMVGTYISFFGAGSFISIIFSGPLADRIGKRKVVVGSILLIIIGSILIAISNCKSITISGLFLIGMGFGPTEAIGSAMLIDENPRQASIWMNISQILFSLGAIIAPIVVVRYYTKESAKYQDLFIASSLIFFILLTYFFLSKYGSENQVVVLKKPILPLGVLKNKKFRVYAGMIFLYLGYESIATTYIKAFFIQNGSTEIYGATAISLFWLAMIIGRLIGVFMSGKEKMCTHLFPPIVGVAICILLFTNSPQMHLLGVILYGFGCGPVWPMLFVLAARLFPNNSGSAYAVMMIFSTAGYMIFPVLLGSLVNNFSITLLGCIILSVMVFILSFAPQKIKQ